MSSLQKLSLFDKLCASMVRKRELPQKLFLRGHHRWEHYRKGRLINVYEFDNDIVNEGKNDILSVYFHDGTATASTSWYVGLISNAGYSGLAATDVMSSHAGWAEFVGYSQSTRPAWGPGAPASQSITNATPMQYDFNASGTVKGGFVTTNNVKSGTGGKLWATALFPGGDIAVSNGDQLKATYTLST